MINLIIILLVVGLVLYLISLMPIDPTIKRVVTVLVLFVVILWVLQAFFPALNHWPSIPLRR